MPHVLNLRSTDTIVPNIAELTGVAPGDIDAFVNNLRDFPKGNLAHRAYWDEFQKRFGVEPKMAQTVVFHGTRCPPTTDFSDGLLPSDKAINLLWNLIWETCRDHLDASSAEELKSRYEQTEHSRKSGGYFDRLTGVSSRERGPWGKVIRNEWLIHGRNGNHYFERGPEIVQIVLSFLSTKHDLNRLFLERTTPCIVHFTTNWVDPYNLGCALSFLRDQRFCEYVHDYDDYYGIYSAEGVSVPYDRIQGIEFIEQANAG